MASPSEIDSCSYSTFLAKYRALFLFCSPSLDWNLHLPRNLRDVELEKLTSLFEVIKDFFYLHLPPIEELSR